MAAMTCYVDHNFTARSLERIGLVNDIVLEYAGQGFRLTLRQLYYQLVARDIIKNTQQQYDNLGALLVDARLAGLVPLEAIEDRTRGVKQVSTWADPKDILRTGASQFRYDKWADQDIRVECWFEKDALAGVFERACAPYEVPRVSTRGYSSISLVHEAFKRFERWENVRQDVLLLHFTDHDPSGLDMTTALGNRLGLRCFGSHVDVSRVALTREQVDTYNPPPNYAKASDSRHETYVRATGTNECWELDALTPQVLAEIVRDEVEAVIDTEQWEKSASREVEARGALKNNAESFEVTP